MGNIRYACLLVAYSLACSQGSDPVTDQPVTLREARPGLLALATITFDDARTIALARTRGGTIEEAELEEEDQTLLYSFEVRAADGVLWDVEVDATSGDVVDVEIGDDDGDDEPADDDDDGQGHHGTEDGSGP